MEILQEVDKNLFLVVECYKNTQLNECLNNFKENMISSHPNSYSSSSKRYYMVRFKKVYENQNLL